MANYRAISATCESVARLLEAAYDPTVLGTALEFHVYRGQDFRAPMTAGVSVFAYRIVHNGTFRSPPSRLATPSGTRRLPQLALDVHFLLTAWGQRPSLELAILGWAARVIEDHAILPASLLNAVAPGSFRDDETVEVAPHDLALEDLMRVWDGIPRDYQTSMSYLARVLRIESLRQPLAGDPVTERQVVWRGP